VQVLKRVLAEIASGNIGNTLELAVATGVSAAMIETVVGDLERRGLLERAGACGSGCGACATESACASKAQASAWMLTARGRRYAEGC
jgi:hypothetical protein